MRFRTRHDPQLPCALLRLHISRQSGRNIVGTSEIRPCFQRRVLGDVHSNNATPQASRAERATFRLVRIARADGDGKHRTGTGTAMAGRCPIRHAEPPTERQPERRRVHAGGYQGALGRDLHVQRLRVSGGLYDSVNAGVLHAILAQLARPRCPSVGMEADPGRENGTIPLRLLASSAKRSNREVEVKLNLLYAKDANGEYQESPQIQRVKYFHYMLTLNENGEIIVEATSGTARSLTWFGCPAAETRRQQRQPKAATVCQREPGARHLAGLGASRRAEEMACHRSFRQRTGPRSAAIETWCRPGLGGREE